MAGFELVAVILVLVVAASILWSTVRYGMPPMPSLGRARRAMIDMVEDPGQAQVVDLGSGWGNLAVDFARRFPKARVEGYEVSWFPWLYSLAVKRILGLNNLSFYRRDFRHAVVEENAVVICYLAREGMQAVRELLERAAPSQVTVISHHFSLPGSQPDAVVELTDLYRTPIYRYHLRWSRNNIEEEADHGSESKPVSD